MSLSLQSDCQPVTLLPANSPVAHLMEFSRTLAWCRIISFTLITCAKRLQRSVRTRASLDSWLETWREQMEENNYNFKNQSNLCVAAGNWYGSSHANFQLFTVTGNWSSGVAVPSQGLSISPCRLYVISSNPNSAVEQTLTWNTVNLLLLISHYGKWNIKGRYVYTNKRRVYMNICLFEYYFQCPYIILLRDYVLFYLMTPLLEICLFVCVRCDID